MNTYWKYVLCILIRRRTIELCTWQYALKWLVYTHKRGTLFISLLLLVITLRQILKLLFIQIQLIILLAELEPLI